MKRRYARTLYNLPSDTTEAWLFESYEARSKVEAAWAEQGKTIKLHSAYKVLLHHLLESEVLDCADEILIRYPVIEGDEPQRFRLECYPVTDLFDGKLQFEAFEQTVEQGKLPFYEVITETEILQIPVPVRWVTTLSQKRQLVACGWIITQHNEGEHLATEFEAIYNDACQHFFELPLQPIHPEQTNGPFFDRLSVNIGLPMQDAKLQVGDETISFIEAMHEDIYFSAIEIFQHRLGLPPHDRSLMPGQVAPEVVHAEQASLAITHVDGASAYKEPEHTRITGATAYVEPEHTEIIGAGVYKETDHSVISDSLDQLEHWLTPRQISEQLDQLAGQSFNVLSRQHRSVEGCAVVNDAAVKLAISGGQHANESSGIVGALRAAHTLKSQGDVDFTVCPLENPDGYALFRQLCENNPRHMHHAARYTSAGNDLTYGTEYESLIRSEAKSHLLADVHVNLHGYPSHEWTRPLSGYVPEGFATWTIPKGFFIICRYNPGFKAQAELMLHAAINAVAGFEAQRQQNHQMLARFLNTVENAGFEIAHGVVPFMFDEYHKTDYPIEIITEAPDETVYGEAFRIAHESHYRVILAIADALRGG